jgi:drug/metabolite transporter (DMT)-like permease
VIVNNLQPFFGVLFALLLLSESLEPLEIAGGILIFSGIYLERKLRHRAVSAAALDMSP